MEIKSKRAIDIAIPSPYL